MADPKIKFKRSAVAGKIPTAAQVPLGEIALNTNDGILYASKDVGAGATVIAVNPFRVGTGTDSYNAFFTAGNVGIGSTLPTAKLDVSGQVNITNSESQGSATTGAVELDGNDSLRVVHDSGFNLGSNNFTVEAWFKYTGTISNYHSIFAFSGGNINIRLRLLSGNVRLDYRIAALGATLSGSDTTVALSSGTWYHVALVRNGNNLNLYLDGVSKLSSTTFTQSFSDQNGEGFSIGSHANATPGHFFPGDISNVRLVNGTAVYTSAFTVPTTQLSNITNTKVLCCQSTSSVTAEATGKTINTTGDPSVASSNPGLTYTATISAPSHLNVSGITTTSVLKVGTGITASGGIVTATTFSGSGASLTNLPAANITGTLPAISGANLTNLNASNLASGTVPDGRFPATLPAASGTNLTNLPAANVTGTLPAISGANLTNLNASNLASGTVPTARIPTLNQDTTGTAAGLTGTPNITVGTVTGASLDISGNVDIDGTLEADAITVDGATLAETISDTVGAMVSSNTESGITVTYQDSDNTLDFSVASQTDENFTTADHSKLDGIEASADVTDATNVAAAGAVMESDSTTASMSFVVDEDNMSSNSATKVPTQQSVKAYVDSQVTAQDLDLTTDSGTIAIDLDSETLTIQGTTNEIETSATGNTVTVGLPNNVTVGNNLTVGNDLVVTGSLTYEDVTNIDSVGLSTFRAGVNITGTATATLFSGSGASLTNLPAANLTGTLPAISGANLTNLDATDLASGTIPDARFPAALPAIDGSALTGITASGTGAIGGLTIKNQSGAVVGTAGSVSTIDFDGSAGVTVSATTGAAGIATVLISADLVTDTSPQLGGNLDLNGNNITGSGNIPAANVTGTLPAISIGGDLSIVDKIVHTGDTNTSIGFPSDDKIQLATNGSPKMTLDNVGRVLIGTTGAPSGTDAQYSKLVIRGNTSSATAVAYLSLGNGKTTSDTGTNENLGILTFNDNDNDAGEYARIIGASDGSNGTDDYPGKLIFSTTADGGSSPTERLRINSSGQVLIGATSGGGLFSVHQATSSTSNYINITNDATGSSSWANGMLLGNNASGDALVWQNENLNLIFGTNNNERMRITATGRMGLGTQNPTSTLHVSGTVTATTFSGSGASLTNIPAANLTGTLPAISGANLTNLDASDLASGTVPDGRFPATLPAASGANLTNLPAANITGTLPAISGANLTNLNGSNISSGTVAAARVGALPASKITTGTFDAARIPTLNQDTTGTAAGLTGTPNITVGTVTAASLDISGNVDVDGTLEADAITIDGATLAETISDTVGAMVSSNTETGITVAYQDSDNTLDFSIGTLNQDTTGTAALAEGLTGSPTIGVSTITTTGSVGIGSTLPTGKLDVLGQVNIKSTSTTTTSGIATSYTGSVYLDGNSDYLTVPGPGTLAASSNWTLECYFYCTGTSSGTYRIVGANESVNGSQYSFIRIRNGQYQFFTDNAYSSTVGTATFNAWHHIAFTKTGTTLRGFVDGVKIYEATDNNSDSITTFVVGWGYGSEYFPGYISNVRFVNGTSLYKENFTPQTAELTKIYNTTHLLAQSSSSATAEATGKTVTAVGTAAASTTNPSLVKGFDLSGSVEFDGSGDYLSVADSTDLDVGLSGDPFTIEAWVYPETIGTSAIFGRGGGASGWNGTNGHQYLFSTYNNKYYIQWWNGSNLVNLNTSSGGVFATNQWSHAAMSYDGTTLRIYVNGEQILSSSATFGKPTNSNLFYIGDIVSGGYAWDGFISNFRVIKGTALYTSNFSPTFTELTNLPDTKLLALQSSSSATAYAVSPGAITAQGNAAASTTSPGLISPHSITGSVEFDGTGDYLTVADSSLNPGTGDFAVEAFVKFASNSGTRRAVVMDTTAYGSNSLSIQQYNNGFEFYCGGQNHYTSGFDMTIWHHALITRKSNTIRYIVDGKIIGTDTSSNNIYGEPTNTLTIGGYNSVSNSEYMGGYISNVRLVVGSVPSEYETTSTSVGTQVFTPTREELTNVTDTKFLGLQSASSATAYAVSPASISAYGDASASSTSPGLVKAYTNASGQTTTTTTTSGNLLVSGITTATNRIDIKSDDSTPGRIDFYCESSNAHYTQLRSAAHASYSGIATVTLPTSTGTLLLTDGSGASLTNLPAANLTGTLPAISGANLTNLDASDLASGTVPDARFPATLPAASGANLTNLPAANITGTLPAISGANLTGIDIGIAGDSGTGTVNTSQSLTIAGTSSEIVTSASGQTITLSLPTTVTNDNFETTAAGRVTTGLIASQNNTDGLTLATGGGKKWLVGRANAEVELYYNNNLKFETTNDGAVVTGIVTATSFSGSGANLTNVNATVAGISTTGTSTFNHVSVTGVATVSTAFYLPQYTTTARDAGTFNEGAMIYNTTLKKMEFYDGTNWVTLPGVTLGLGMGVF